MKKLIIIIASLALAGCMTTTKSMKTVEVDPWTDEKTVWIETVTEPSSEAKILAVGSLMVGALAVVVGR